MRYFLLTIVTVFLGITTTFGQDTDVISTDSLSTSEKFKNQVESVNVILNNWQLASHETFENYPENKIGDTDFTKEKSF